MVDLKLRLELPQCCLPRFEVQTIVPRIEARAETPRPLDQPAGAVVAAGDDRFEPRYVHVVLSKAEAVLGAQVIEQVLFPLDLFQRIHRRPLEGRMWLGYVARDGDGHRGVTAIGTPDLQSLA